MEEEKEVENDGSSTYKYDDKSQQPYVDVSIDDFHEDKLYVCDPANNDEVLIHDFDCSSGLEEPYVVLNMIE